MPAITTIIAGVSAVAAIDAGQTAKGLASKQADAQAAQKKSQADELSVALEQNRLSAASLASQKADSAKALGLQQEANAALTAKNDAQAKAAAQSNLKAAEAAKLAGQDQGLKVADVELGTSKASDELLKRTKATPTAKAKTTSGTKVGGLKKGTATKVGGL